MMLHRSQHWTSEFQPISLFTRPSCYLPVQEEHQTNAGLRKESGFVYKSKSLVENEVQIFFNVFQFMPF